MAYSLLVHAAAGAVSNATTAGIDTTGTNLIVVGISQYQAVTIGSLSDSKGNTWTPLTAQSILNSQYCQLFYCFGPTVGSGHTFTWNGTSNFGSIAVAGFSGAAASPFDQQNGATNKGVTTLQTGSVTPSVANELIITACSFGASGVASINSGFAITDQINYLSGTREGVALAYLIQTTATAENPTWTSGASNDIAAVIETFEAASGGGSTIVHRRTLSALGTRTGSRQVAA